MQKSIDEEVFVTITKKEYERLLKDSHWLACLEGAGVDNWEGYDIALELLNEEEETN